MLEIIRNQQHWEALDTWIMPNEFFWISTNNGRVTRRIVIG